MAIERFTDLKAWQEGHKLVLLVYDVTKLFPSEEQFSLTNQIRRAVVSVTSNIAEGFGRQSSNDKKHFYIMARGSILEIQNQLLIAKDVQILDSEKYEIILSQSNLTHKILNGLIKSIRGTG